MTAPDDPQTTGQADRDSLAAILVRAGWSEFTSRHMADAILASDWLADLLAAERARTLAPILALADEWEASLPKPAPFEGIGGRKGTIRTTQNPLQWQKAQCAADLRAVLDPDAATRHDHEEGR